jgi:hypothetical protein
MEEVELRRSAARRCGLCRDLLADCYVQFSGEAIIEIQSAAAKTVSRQMSIEMDCEHMRVIEEA